MMKFGSFFRRIALKTKIISATTLVIVLTTVVGSGFFYGRAKDIIFGALEKRGRTICENLSHSAKYGVLTEDKEILDELARGVMRPEDVVYVVIQNAQGEILAEKMVIEIPDMASLKKEALLPGEGKISSVKDKSGKPIYNVSAPIITRKVSLAEIGGVPPELEEEEEPVRKLRGAVMVGVSLSNALSKLRKVLQGIIVLTLIIIGAGVIVSLGFVRIIMAPVANMARAAVGVASGDLTQTVKVESQDEIGQFAGQFNAMTRALREREQQLEESYNELNDYKNRLEEKVEERTKQLKQTQAELAQKEKLAALGQLAAGVGHELRNPLAAIKNSVYYLKTKISGENSKIAKHVEIMDREIGGANKIITDLLGFSRVSRGEFVPVKINEVVNNTFPGLFLPPTVKVIKELKAELPRVKGDADQLKQVFLNMVLNAAQAMPEGGELKVSTRAKDGFVEIEFTDTGVGISRENFDKIFDPFFTTKAKGIGLGLAVSYGIVERHGGRIDIQSEVGKGTTFTVILPVSSS